MDTATSPGVTSHPPPLLHRCLRLLSHFITCPLWVTRGLKLFFPCRNPDDRLLCGRGGGAEPPEFGLLGPESDSRLLSLAALQGLRHGQCLMSRGPTLCCRQAPCGLVVWADVKSHQLPLDDRTQRPLTEAAGPPLPPALQPLEPAARATPCPGAISLGPHNHLPVQQLHCPHFTDVKTEPERERLPPRSF